MPQDKIESRRAFMKKFGKLASIALATAPFVAMTTPEVNAKPYEDSPVTGCGGGYGNCSGSCFIACEGTCKGGCEGTCSTTCVNTCSGRCDTACGFSGK